MKQAKYQNLLDRYIFWSKGKILTKVRYVYKVEKDYSSSRIYVIDPYDGHLNRYIHSDFKHYIHGMLNQKEIVKLLLITNFHPSYEKRARAKKGIDKKRKTRKFLSDINTVY